MLLRAAAGTVPVTNTHESLAGSLRQAVQDANPGDTIVFHIPVSDPGYSSASGVTSITYTGPSGPESALVIAKDLTIDGAGAKIVLSRSSASGTAEFRLFDITAGNVTIANLTIYNGYCPSGGGGLRNAAQLTVRGCAFGSNFGGGGAGGLQNDAAGTAAISNCTFYGNTTGSFGRAIQSSGVVRLTNSTISQNPVKFPSSDAAVASTGGTFHIANTIVAGNAPNGAYADVYGPFISEGYNFIGDPYGGSGSASSGFGLSGSHDQVGTHASPGNPQLGGIAFGTGPTPYFQPQAGSPVIDQGNRGLDGNGQPINIDQRGVARPVDQPSIANAGDGSDIGAIELGLAQAGPAYTVTTTSEHDDGSCSTDDCTLLEALNAANANADVSTLNFAAGVTGTIVNTTATSGLFIVNSLTINGPGARFLTVSTGAVVTRLFNITSSAGNVQISGLTMANGIANSGDGLGGAIRNAANLTLTDCALTDNLAAADGGAIYHDGSNHTANLTLVNCTISGSGANASGGAIFIGAYGGHTTVNLTNCTLDHNTAGQYGGAIYNDGTGNGNAALTVTNCTFNQNAAPNTGGIVTDGLNPGSSGIATVTLRNTILRTGSNGGNLASDGGTITSQGNNLSDDPAGGSAGTAPGGFLNAAGDIRNTDPQLGSLGNNGGPTDTIPLLPGSVATNGGNDANAPATDQRGFSRAGVSDIGAFEFDGVAPVLKITSVVRQNGHLILHGRGVASRSQTIEAAADPNGGNFSSIGTAISDAAGGFQYDDAGAVGLTNRFYRVAAP